MMRQRNSGGATIASSTVLLSHDVESVYSHPPAGNPFQGKRKGRSFRRSTYLRRLVYLVLFIGLIYFGWRHCQRAYTLYSLPGVKKLLQEAPRVLGDDYVVFLTASSGEPGQTYIAMGRSKQSPVVALMQAQAKLPKKSYPWIKLDVVDDIEKISGFDYFSSIDAPGGWFGLALDWHHRWAFLPEEVRAHGLVDKDGVLRWEKVLSYAHRKKLKGWPVPPQSDDATEIEFIDVFHTESVFYNLEQATPIAVPIYHGHRMYNDVSPEVLQDAIIDAGEYMADSVDADGTMTYMYNPRSDLEPPGYDLTRHAAAIYAMSCMYAKWKDPELLEGMKAAMDYLVKHVHECQVPHRSGLHTKCVVEKNEIDGERSKTGANAMTVLAIAEYMEATKDQSYYKIAKDVSIFIGGGQREDGLLVHKVALPHFKSDDTFFVRYYQGQTAFALSRLNTVVQSLGMPADEQWVQVASKAAEYQVSQDALEDDEDFVIDHWLLYGIGELPRSKVTQNLIDYVSRSIQIAYDNQNGEMENEEELDRLGVFFGDMSSAATAAKSEGLCAVYSLAVEQKHTREVERIVESVTMGIRYQLQTQYQPEHAMYMRNPKRILGGFHESIVNTEMRIDFTYHNVCSLLCAAEMFAHQEQSAKQTAT